MMKSRPLHRIYIDSNFLTSKPIRLDGDILHYLRDVIRLKVNDKIRIFNEIIGEYLAKVIICDKKEIHLELLDTQNLRLPTPLQKLSIAPSLIKNDKFACLIDMAVQLGVTEIIPIITARTIFRSYNPERLRRIIIEAVEQSERLDMPIISNNPIKLQLVDFMQYDLIIYANEKADTNIKPDIAKLSWQNILLITGPEGGFTLEELEFLVALPNSYGITLGDNILRAETAMVKLISYVGLARQYLG